MKYAKISDPLLELLEICDECGVNTCQYFWLGVDDDVSMQTHDFVKETREFVRRNHLVGN